MIQILGSFPASGAAWFSAMPPFLGKGRVTNNNKAYRIRCVQEQKLPDEAKRLQFCRWLLSTVEEGRMDPLLYFMSDEAWFHLSGYVNSQNTRYWSSKNWHVIHEMPLHDLKIGVWCAVSGIKIVGLILF